MADPEVNEAETNPIFSEEADEERLLAEDNDEIQDCGTTGDTTIDPKLIWKAIQGLEEKFDLLAGTSNTHITDASLKWKSNTDKSKKDKNTPPGPPCKMQSQSSSVHDASEDSDRELIALLEDEEDEQDADSSDKLLKEIKEEYNTEDKTGPDVNVHLANHVNKRFAGKLKDTKLKEKFELYFRPGNCDRLNLFD